MQLQTLGLALCLAQLFEIVVAGRPPNILFILTDDQDWHMESMQHMPFLQKYLINEGTLFANHYCTVALCCPSRVTLWTGRAAHNTNVTDVWAPYGEYPKVVKQGINDDYLPHWLQAAGYNTYYAGKLWNHHSLENYNQPYAGGFNSSDFLLDPYTYSYRNATMTRNGAPPVTYEGQYSPDVTAKKAYGLLSEAMAHDKPWFLVHAPIAPHSSVNLVPEIWMDKPMYADRHAHLFKDYIIPRDENFNPEVQDGVSWVKSLPRLNDTVIAYNDEFQRSRLRALQSVDEMVEQVVKMLTDAGQLENTYIIYTTDNGYHISQHRMHPGKECGFEADVHIPLIIRGPGIPAGHTSQAVTSHTDIASTIMKLAGRPLAESDGSPLPLFKHEEALAKHEHVGIEFWGLAIPETQMGGYGGEDPGHPGYGDVTPIAVGNNTYKGVRVIGKHYNLYYAVWCTNENELYDLVTDPGEMRNLLSSDHADIGLRIANRPLAQIVSRLDALMMVLKSCKGRVCVEPWRQLHPKGDVTNLIDSLRAEYDEFYESQPKVSFAECKLGYLPEFEGPMNVNQFQDHVTPGFEYRNQWSIWT